jgi:hypothetical protein
MESYATVKWRSTDGGFDGEWYSFRLSLAQLFDKFALVQVSLQTHFSCSSEPSFPNRPHWKRLQGCRQILLKVFESFQESHSNS